MLKVFARFLFLVVILSSCNFYSQHVMLEIDKETAALMLKQQVKEAERNYLVRKNDQIEFQLFTNKGEIIVDPTNELAKILGATGGGGGSAGRTKYLIQWDGKANLPLIGKIKLDSFTVAQVDSVLAAAYSKFYQDVFVITKVENRRVIILNLGQGGMLGGGAGGGGQGGGGVGMMMMGNRARVVPLDHENMNIFEVLAIAGGIGMYAHAEKIRIIRGDLRNPQVILINLRTVASVKKSDIRIFPNDIIYVEPGRRIIFEAIGDFTGIISLLLSFTTLLVLTSTRF